MHISQTSPRILQMLNQTLVNVKEALIEWAEGFVGY